MRRWVLAPLVAVVTVACGGGQVRREAPRPAAVRDDGELVVTTTDGALHHSRDLVGAIIKADGKTVRIEAVTSEAFPGRRVWLHRMVIVADDGSTSELCLPDPHGERWALVVRNPAGELELTCSSGAVGKCIRWGYPPAIGREVHDACVRMVRADYGGDGATWTRDGTLIAFCDRAGIHPCHDTPRIEAAWTPAGASCVGYPRIPELVSLPDLATRYPRLQGAVGSTCTLDHAPDAKLFSWTPHP